MFYKRYEKTNLTITTSIISSLVLALNIMSLIFILNYFDLIPNFPNIAVVALFMFIIWFINYNTFVKNEKFLNFEFKKDKKGGYIVVIVFVITAFLSIYIGNLNRNKISKHLERAEINDAFSFNLVVRNPINHNQNSQQQSSKTL
jgi:hypothetical protein